MNCRIKINTEEQYNYVKAWTLENPVYGKIYFSWLHFSSAQSEIITFRSAEMGGHDSDGTSIGHCKQCETHRGGCCACSGCVMPLYTFQEFRDKYAPEIIDEEEYYETGQTISFDFLII